MIHPESQKLIDRYNSLLKENKRLQAEYTRIVADLESQFLEFRGRLAKKPKPS
jgi:hypothetical protein